MAELSSIIQDCYGIGIFKDYWADIISRNCFICWRICLLGRCVLCLMTRFDESFITSLCFWSFLMFQVSISNCCEEALLKGIFIYCLQVAISYDLSTNLGHF